MNEEKTIKQHSASSAPTKSIMKKTGSLTPDAPASTTMESSSVIGFKRGKQQTIEDLLGESTDKKEEEKPEPTTSIITGNSSNLASKRV